MINTQYQALMRYHNGYYLIYRNLGFVGLSFVASCYLSRCAMRDVSWRSTPARPLSHRAPPPP